MRFQACCRRGSGVVTELMPINFTPRRMKGATEVGKVHALGQAAGGDGAVIVDLRDDIGKRGGAYGIDGAGPAHFGERLYGHVEFIAVNDCRGAEFLQKIGFLRAAG